MSQERLRSAQPLGQRTRHRLMAVAEEHFHEVKTELEGVSDSIMRMMDANGSRDSIDALFQQWDDLYKDLLDADCEFARHLPETEYRSHSNRMDRYVSSAGRFCRRVEDYLKNTPRVRSVSSQPAFRDSITETERLRQEITRIQTEIIASASASGLLNSRPESSPAAEDQPLGRSSSAPAPSFGCALFSEGDRAAPASSRRQSLPSLQRSGSYISEGEPLPDPDPDPFAARNLNNNASPEATVPQGGQTGMVMTPALMQQIMMQAHTTAVTSLAQAMESREDKLPPLEPPVFSGDLLSFPSWWSRFQVAIESRAKTNQARLQYLGKYTSGAAEKAILYYLNSPHDENSYEEAKQTLLARFGDKIQIADAFKDKLNNWPPIKKGDADSLMDFSDFLKQTLAAMKTMSYLDSLDSREENRRLVSKLPIKLAESWYRITDRWLFGSRSEGFQNRTATGQYPPFEEFCRFVADEARIARGSFINVHSASKAAAPVNQAPVQALGRQGGVSRRKVSLATDATAASETPRRSRTQQKCQFCSYPHATIECRKFRRQTVEQRKDWTREHHLCFGCLGRGHQYRDCRHKDQSLFEEPVQPSASADSKATSASAAPETPPESKAAVSNATRSAIPQRSCTMKSAYSSMMLPVELFHKDFPKRRITVCASLDTQSDTCFLSNEVMEFLDSANREVMLDIICMGSECTVMSWEHNDLRVSPCGSDQALPMPPCYSREAIPGDPTKMMTRDQMSRWEHLRPALPEVNFTHQFAEIGLLVGHNFPEAFYPKETLKAEVYQPYAIETPLGWTVMGRLEASMCEGQAMCFKTRTREVIPDNFNVAFDSVFSGENLSSKKSSAQDERFLQIMRDGLTRDATGRITMPLPLKDGVTRYPRNRTQAVKRLLSQKRKFQRNPDYADKYITFIRDLFTNDHAERVPPQELDEEDACYLPHQGVTREDKPDVVRVVFDPTVECEGVSLNSLLLPGPDLLNDLSGVLMRFRKEPVGYGCDVRKMFLQFLVTPRFRNLMRFVWFEGDQLGGKIIDCRMKVHIFGATSSPACANYALKYLAELYREKYGEEVADFIQREFYVDDGYGSSASVEEAEKVLRGSKELCAEAGIDLTKFTSNSRELLSRFPADWCAPDVQSAVQNVTPLPTGKSLGSGWDRERDEWVFMSRNEKSRPTRRAMLSLLSSVFDPMGFIGPVLLPGRRVLQALCKAKLGWDDAVGARSLSEWNDWESDLSNLEKIRIARCIRQNASRDLSRTELHTFSDASDGGYGACSYAVLRSSEGTDSNLMFAKSKVPPVKAVDTPRMELQAAVLAAQVAVFVEEELRYPSLILYFWTDSVIVLGYISNDARRFHVYVRNRVQKIRDVSRVDQWGYVNTLENPADIASRGCTVSELADSDLWWHGPGFLLKGPPEDFKVEDYQGFLPENDPEIRKVSTVAVCVKKDCPEDPVLQAIRVLGTWRQMVNTVAIWRRWLGGLLAIIRPEREQPAELYITVLEKQQAMAVIIAAAQRECYPDEYKRLLPAHEASDSNLERLHVGKSSSLARLDVFKAADGTLRVGGRLQRSSLPREVAQPWILPRKLDISTKIIVHHHERLQHPGRAHTVNAVRAAGFWICQIRSAVGSVIASCVICRRYRGPLMHQKMSELPVQRVTESAPFTYCGADCFGPVYVKNGRALRKRWFVLFTCLAMRGIHLEVLYDMSADSLILAVRRLINRRGPLRVLYCDRGTNFIGADTELSRAMKEMDFESLRNELSKEECDFFSFKYIPPKAPYMGGIWERQVRSAKSVLMKMMNRYGERMDDECLTTVASEVECVVNSRPVTAYDDTSADALMPLSPAQILTLKSKAVAPLPGVFVEQDLYLRKRWRKVQELANIFWDQWRREFLPTLQERRKWQTEGDSLQPGDVVVISDPDLPRNRWPLARVTEVIPSKDGLIRSAKVKTQTSVLERPLQSLVLIYREEEPRP